MRFAVSDVGDKAKFTEEEGGDGGDDEAVSTSLSSSSARDIKERVDDNDDFVGMVIC